MILCYQLVLINRMIPASPRNLPTIHGLTDDDRPDLRMALTLCSAWAMKQWLEPLTKARGTRWDRVPQGWKTRRRWWFEAPKLGWNVLNPYFLGIETDDLIDLTQFPVLLTPAIDRSPAGFHRPKARLGGLLPPSFGSGAPGVLVHCRGWAISKISRSIDSTFFGILCWLLIFSRLSPFHPSLPCSTLSSQSNIFM